MSDTEVKWYEKPIEVASADGAMRSMIFVARTSVRNGENGTNVYPSRHYWKDADEQREDVADLQYLASQLDYERARNAFLEAIRKAYAPFILPEMGADESVSDDGS